MPFQPIDPRKLFLMDSSGALLSALMLGVVLVKFEPIFGMPSPVLYALAFLACIFSIYSFLCYVGKTGNWRPYMKIIAITNLMYCCLTMGLIVYFHQKLTVLGLLYFVLEIMVVTVLAMIEWKTAAKSAAAKMRFDL